MIAALFVQTGGVYYPVLWSHRASKTPPAFRDLLLTIARSYERKGSAA